MFIGMDPPKHDRLKMLFQAGFTPRRIAAHEPRDPPDRHRRADRLDGRDECDLVTDVAQPIVSRVIGSFMGIPEEDDAIWARLMNASLGAGDPDLNSGRHRRASSSTRLPEIFARCQAMIAERREHPTDDLTSVLVHAEIDGQKLEEHEIVMGFFLLVAAGNDSTKATYCSGMRALMEHPDRAPGAARRPVADPERGRGVAADVPGVRALPPHRDLRHRARRPADPRGRQGRDVVRVLQPRRVPLRGPRPLRRAPQPRAPGVRRRRPALLPRRGARPAGAQR